MTFALFSANARTFMLSSKKAVVILKYSPFFLPSIQYCVLYAYVFMIVIFKLTNIIYTFFNCIHQSVINVNKIIASWFFFSLNFVTRANHRLCLISYIIQVIFQCYEYIITFSYQWIYKVNLYKSFILSTLFLICYIALWHLC